MDGTSSKISFATSLPSSGDSYIEEEIDLPNPDTPNRTVGVVELVFLAFFCVSGGSYGLEEAVRAGYPLFALLGLLVIPWFWSLPTALMTAELSTTMPENGGYVVWTRRAFGPFWAFQSGYWGWLNNIIDNSLYPVMFVEYLTILIGEVNQVWKIAVCWLVVIFVTVLNIIGIELVGKLAILFAITVTSPFFLMALWGMPQIDFDAIGKVPHPLADADWGLYLSVLLWNTCGWDAVGNIAGEVKNPEKTFPKGLLIALVFVIISYAWPLAIAVSIDHDYAKWFVGYFPDITAKLGGNGYRIYTTTVGLVSSLGLFNALLCTSARSSAALAPEDLLDWPALGKLHPKFKTPWVSVLLNSGFVLILSILHFQSLVEIDVIFYSLPLIFKFLSLLYLRKKEPDIERPYRIPLNIIPLGIFCTPPIILCLMTMIWTDLFTKVMSISLIIFGVGFYFAFHKFKQWRRSKEATLNYSELKEFFSDKAEVEDLHDS